MAKKRRKVARRKPARRKTARKSNPVSVACNAISKVAKPGATFSRTKLKQKLKKKFRKTTGGAIDQMVGYAKKRRLITPVTKTKYVFTPAAAGRK
jgi:hypothetical protein